MNNVVIYGLLAGCGLTGDLFYTYKACRSVRFVKAATGKLDSLLEVTSLQTNSVLQTSEVKSFFKVNKNK